jgi:predicted RNA-binding Zn-ribbon protein involved in translation (DUF1610 family)
MSGYSLGNALRKVGTRSAALGTCPVCGHKVRHRHEHVRAWSGKYAHSDCASYQPRSRRSTPSQGVHKPFTAA